MISPTPTRAEVYAAIDAERLYQDQKWHGSPGFYHNATEWLVYIENYVDEAKAVLSRREEPFASNFALHTLRKIAAMAVAAMEQNGVQRRDAEGPRPVGFVQT